MIDPWEKIGERGTAQAYIFAQVVDAKPGRDGQPMQPPSQRNYAPTRRAASVSYNFRSATDNDNNHAWTYNRSNNEPVALAHYQSKPCQGTHRAFHVRHGLTTVYPIRKKASRMIKVKNWRLAHARKQSHLCAMIVTAAYDSS